MDNKQVEISGAERLKFLYEELNGLVRVLEEFKKTKERYSNRMVEFNEKLKNEEMLLIRRGNYIIKQIAEIEEITDIENTYVNINDIVDIRMAYADDDVEEMTLQLVSGYGTIFDGRLSVNTPLGKEIYGRKVGDAVLYKVNNNVVKAKVLKKTLGKNN